jgi:Tfp pilus assembly protein PilX
MKAGRFNGGIVSNPRQQRGVVLLIALIILVAMTLAGIGMMRSVDTGGVIAGNMAFRQSTLHASDIGTSAGFNAMASLANSNNIADKQILNFSNGQPCSNVPGATAAGCQAAGASINLPGYAATPLQACEVTNVCAQAPAWWTVAANWNGAATAPAVLDPTNGSTIATVQYLIHRMCISGGSAGAAGQLCQTYTQPASGCSKTQLLPCSSTSIFYRITTRSVGPRNTVTYAQSLVLISN